MMSRDLRKKKNIFFSTISIAYNRASLSNKVQRVYFKKEDKTWVSSILRLDWRCLTHQSCRMVGELFV